MFCLRKASEVQSTVQSLFTQCYNAVGGADARQVGRNKTTITNKEKNEKRNNCTSRLVLTTTYLRFFRIAIATREPTMQVERLAPAEFTIVNTKTIQADVFSFEP